MAELDTAVTMIVSRLDLIDGRLGRIEDQMVSKALCDQRERDAARRLESCETRLDEAQRVLLGARGSWSAISVLGALVAALASIGVASWVAFRPAAPTPPTIVQPIAFPHLIPISFDAGTPLAPRKGRR